MKGFIVGMLMFGVGWGFTEFLAASLEEYQTVQHRPDDAWMPEQLWIKPALQLPDYGSRARAKAGPRDGPARLMAAGAGPQEAAVCDGGARPTGGAC
jgi:hypothetical protein